MRTLQTALFKQALNLIEDELEVHQGILNFGKTKKPRAYMYGAFLSGNQFFCLKSLFTLLRIHHSVCLFSVVFWLSDLAQIFVIFRGLIRIGTEDQQFVGIL